MTAHYGTEEVYACAINGNSSFCHWDLSRLPDNEYEPLFGGLPNVLYKKLESARFSIELLRMIQSRVVSISSVDLALSSSSIAEKVHRYPRRLVKILAAVLPQTKILKSLELNGVALTREQVNQVLQVAVQSPTLKILRVVAVPVSRNAVSAFLDAGAPYQFQEVAFVNCGLEAGVATNAVQFIQTAPREMSGNPWALKSLDLSENEVDVDTQRQIDKLLRSKIGAVGREDDDVEGGEEERVRSLQERVEEVKPAAETENPFEVNQNLRNELEQLLQAMNGVAIGDDVYLIGPSAAENAAVIRQCERIVEDEELSE
jgi:hypothetical protein